MILCAIGSTEIILIAVVILLIFGGKKIPELMKGVGQGVRQFKKGLNEESSEDSEKERKIDRETLLQKRLQEKERKLRESGIDPYVRNVDIDTLTKEHDSKTTPPIN